MGRKPRVPKKSPWHRAQTNRQLSKLKRVYSRVAGSKAFSESAKMFSRGLSKIPDLEKRAFLEAHASAANNVLGSQLILAKYIPDVWANDYLRQTIRNPALNDQVLDIWVGLTAKRLIKSNESAQKDSVKRHYLDYFKKRGIPVVSKVFNSAFESYVEWVGLEQFATVKLTPGIFEKRYFAELARNRAEEHSAREFANLQLKEASKGMRLTSNQTLTAKRWLLRNAREFDRMFQFILAEKSKRFPQDLVLGGEQLREVKEEAKVEFASQVQARLKNEVLKNFVQVKKTRVSTATATQTGVRKFGERAKRIAQHTAEIQEREKKVVAVAAKKETARVEGKPFNEKDYCLTELAKENERHPRVVELITQFSALGKLSDANLTNLYSAGTNAQRIFVKAIDEHGFIQRFGVGNVDSLARMVSVIGPFTLDNGTLAKLTRFPRAEEMRKFLKSRGLIDTHHRGGTAVVLKKAWV